MAGPGAGSGYVGREAELERLGRRLEAALDGRGGLVVLRGPSGIGTTRTAYEAAARADRLGMVTLWGTTVEGLAGRPFGALAEALEEFGISLSAGSLRILLASGAPAIVRLCPRLREVVPDIPPAAPLEAADERLRLHDAVVGFLSRAAAQQPLVLVIDDVQWCDEDSIGLLEQVVAAARSRRLLVVASDATLDGPIAAASAAVSALADEVIELPGLDEGALGSVLDQLGARPLAAGVVTAIHQASGGHPVFARELFRHAVEEDRLATGGGASADDLPATLDAVIAWRLSRLPLETRTLVSALACFPAGATPGLLAHVTAMARSRLVEAVERAVAGQLVRLGEYGRHYSIYHDRVRRAIQAATSTRVRASLHRRAVDALEAEFGDEARAHAAELVDHLVRAATIDPAPTSNARVVRHFLVAAEQARAAYAFRRAATCLSHGVATFGEGTRSSYVELVARRAVAEAEAGHTDDAVRSVRELVGGQRRHGSLTREAWDDVVAAIRTLRYAGENSTSAGLARTALDEGTPREEMVRARLRILAEDWLPADVAGIRSLRWQEGEGPAATLLLDRGDEADRGDLFLRQRTRDAVATARVVSLSANWHRPASVLRAVLAVTTDLLTRHGEFGEGASHAGRYLAAAERAGSVRDVARALMLLGQARAALGELATAAEIFAAADEVLGRIPEPAELSTERLLAELALAHYRDGDWQALAGAVADVRAGEAQPAGLILAAEHALATARAARESEARVLLAAVLEGVTDVEPLTYGRDVALFGALTAAWEVGAAEHALAGRQLVERAAAAGAGGSHTATPRLAMARLHGLLGNVDDARDHFAHERSRLDGLGLRPLRAIIDHDEAIAIAATGTGFADAGALLAGALEQFDALGMTGWADRARWLQAAGFEAAAEPGGRLHFSYPAGLSRREADVVRLLTAGSAPADAARALEVDESVLERHLSNALEKLGATSVDELPRLARRHGLGGV